MVKTTDYEVCVEMPKQSINYQIQFLSVKIKPGHDGTQKLPANANETDTLKQQCRELLMKRIYRCFINNLLVAMRSIGLFKWAFHVTFMTLTDDS